MRKQTIAEELRAKQSRDNRELLDRAADCIEYLEAEAVKWHHEYHKVKEDLRQAKIYENSAHKLAEQYHEELQTAKAEAIKKFAERAKEKMQNLARMQYGSDEIYFLIGESFIDSIAKELTEGPNNAIQT